MKRGFCTMKLFLLLLCAVLLCLAACSKAYRQEHESFIVVRSFETQTEVAEYMQGALDGALDALKERQIEAREFPSPFTFGDEQKLYKCSYDGSEKFLFIARKGNRSFLCAAAPSIRSLKRALKKYEE